MPIRIGELARRTGVSERLLRYYEEQGLLRPARTPSGYREYAEADTDAVRKIRTLLSAGLGTALIAQILPCMHDDGRGLLAPTCAEMLTALEAAQDRIRSCLTELQSSQDVLTAVMARAPDPDPESAPDPAPDPKSEPDPEPESGSQGLAP